MKIFFKKFLWGIVALLLIQSISFASAGRGQRFFDQNLKKECGLNGILVARSHTQLEWTKIYQEDKLNSTMQSLCPSAKPLAEHYRKDIYDYMYAFAKDSGAVVGGC